MYVCHSNGTFIFTQKEEEKVQTRHWKKDWPVAKKSTSHEQVAIVSKILYLYLSVAYQV